MFDLMTDCWAPYPRERPMFRTIVQKLKNFKEEEPLITVWCHQLTGHTGFTNLVILVLPIFHAGYTGLRLTYKTMARFSLWWSNVLVNYFIVKLLVFSRQIRVITSVYISIGLFWTPRWSQVYNMLARYLKTCQCQSALVLTMNNFCQNLHVTGRYYTSKQLYLEWN